MELNRTIDAALFRNMLISGASLLDRNHEKVNALNVFPVPDGDTGSNMSMTLNAAVRELKSNESQNVGELSQVVARGALRGARGNSGVILSQLLRGMAQIFGDKETIGMTDFAAGFKQGSDAAYKAVMRPKEGTILTVSREIADAALAEAEKGEDLLSLMRAVLRSGEKALARTPEQLPVLKEAGVVDSGGKGLIYIISGALLALEGQSIDDFSEEDWQHEAGSHTNMEILSLENTADIVYGYCTEFFIERLHPDVTPSDINALHDGLQRIGDSVVAVADADLVKIHVHTNDPGKVLQMALRLGEINGIKIENMREEHRELLAARKAKRKAMGIVAVSSGKGFDTLFRDSGVEGIVSGGQSMNPSAQDIEETIRRVNADHIFVLPNNKNIFLAAEQAAQLVAGIGEQTVTVLKTQSVQQGLAAALMFDLEATPQDNEKEMTAAIAEVQSGAVTTAVRDTTIDGLAIHKGDYIGLLNEEIVVSEASIDAALASLEKKMIDEDCEYISVFYGKDVTEEEAKAVAQKIEDDYPDADIVLREGGQPLYPYLLSVE